MSYEQFVAETDKSPGVLLASGTVLSVRAEESDAGPYSGADLGVALTSDARLHEFPGTSGGGKVEFNLAALMPKRASLTGTVLRARPLEEKIALAQKFAAEMLPLFDSGRLKPVIDSRFSLDQIADAHRLMEANANVGKILIEFAN